MAEGEGLEYRDYFEYSEPIAHIPPHRVLAINRGEKEGPLKVKLDVSRPDLEQATVAQLPLEGHPQAEFFRASALDALDRLLLPSMEREVRRELTEMAERHAVDVFARNLRSLLLQPPITKQVVMAIDPGFRNGCKVAVLGSHGELLDHGVIHPHPPQNRRHEAKNYLKDWVGKHKVGVVAIGNGTACRETEELIAEIISEGTHFHNNPDAAPPEPPAPSISAEPAAEVAEALIAPAEPAAGEVEAAPEPEHPAPSIADAEGSSNGDAQGSSHDPATEPVESMPPISGGSPEADSEGEAGPKPEEAVAPPSDLPELAAEAPPSPDATPIPAPPEPEVHGQVPEGAVPPSDLQQDPSPGPENVTAVGAPTEAPAAPAGDAPAADAPAGDPATPAGPAAPAPSSSRRPKGERGPRPPRSEQPPRPPKPKLPPPPPRPHPADAQLAQLAYVIVNEAGASVYSVSPVGREEFPDFDDKVRGTISIGRRLQDPLAELVKIEPQNIGVGLYQHDVNPKQLKESLEGVIASCVNFVGVDLNTASVPLLRHVSGLNQLTARRVVERRTQQGPFTEPGPAPGGRGGRAGDLHPGRRVPQDRRRRGPARPDLGPPGKLSGRREAADRLRLRPRDRPRPRPPARAARQARRGRHPRPGQGAGGRRADPPRHLRGPGPARPRPPRRPPKPIFKKGVLKLEDLVAGMELKGTVLNVVDFGAFVDIGLKDSGLVHISQLANRYIKSPHDVVSVGDVVSVWVMGVDGERKRVSLTMVKPGTERPRAERQAGGGQGGRRPQGEGAEAAPAATAARRGRGRAARGASRHRPPTSPRPPSACRWARGPARPRTRGAAKARPRRPDPRPSGRESNFQPANRGPNRGGGGFRPGGPGGAGGGRGGPSRPPERAPQGPVVPPKPAKPAPPPPPLSKDALTGSVPLRSFGQLKQLWQAKDGDEPGPEGQQAPPDSPPPHPEP